MPKMIVVSESPLDTERLSDVLKRADITVKVEFPTQNTFPKETRYRVLRKNGTAVFECVIRTFCSSLEVAELSQKNKKTKKQKNLHKKQTILWNLKKNRNFVI